MTPLVVALKSNMVIMRQSSVVPIRDTRGLLHEGSLDAERRDGVTFQICPVCQSKLVMNQEWEKYMDQFQDYVFGHQV